MIPFWWIIPAFIVGATVGAMLMGLCCANGSDRSDDE